MKLECLGATEEVTGSSYLVDGKLMVDCGIFQGSEENDRLNYSKPKYDPRAIKALFLTHSHLDHCGLIPRLVEQGFDGNIYMTEPTKALVGLTLKDQAIVKRKNQERPLYSQNALDKAKSKFVTVEYGKPFEVDDYTVEFENAWHILGSGMVKINKTAQKYPTLLFTGDVGDGFKLTDAKADIVVTESTYGDRNHHYEDPFEVFKEAIKWVEKRKFGKLLIPVFSVDRAQVTLSIMHYLEMMGFINKDTRTILDSPMAQAVTKEYARYIYPEDDFAERNRGYFEFKGLITATSYQESQRIQKVNKPKIIIAGAGMLQGGRGRGHAVNILPDRNSLVLFTGYQGEGTLGRELVDGAEEVVIDDYIVPVNAGIEITESLSAHADQDCLIQGINRLDLNNPKGLKKVFITHGDILASHKLKEKLESELYLEAIVPKRNKVYEF